MRAPVPLNPSDCARIVRSPEWVVHVAPSGCHLWQGSTLTNGYGRIAYGRTAAGNQRVVLVHRVALVAALGRDLDPSMVVDHLCRNVACVNPDHLEEVSQRINWARGTSPSAESSRGIVCSAGHVLAGDNLLPELTRPGKRRCRACQRFRDQERHMESKRAAQSLGISTIEFRRRFGTSRVAIAAALEESP